MAEGFAYQEVSGGEKRYDSLSYMETTLEHLRLFPGDWKEREDVMDLLKLTTVPLNAVVGITPESCAILTNAAGFILCHGEPRFADDNLHDMISRYLGWSPYDRKPLQVQRVTQIMSAEEYTAEFRNFPPELSNA